MGSMSRSSNKLPPYILLLVVVGTLLLYLVYSDQGDGGEKQGVWRQSDWHYDHFEDVVLYSLLAHEWRELAAHA